MDRSELFEKARLAVKEAFVQRDKLLVQAVNAISESTKANNLLLERLVEWYKIYLPELRVEEPEKYAEIASFLDKEKVDEARLAGILGEQKARFIAEKAKNSLGSDLQPKDLSELQGFAARIKSNFDYRKQLEAYTESLAKEVCPNITLLLGPILAAKMIAQAGGLTRLATMPASTIQVLGAEKALFKHLKQHTKPPKHGLLFQHPAINNAPKKLRGKIARTLAAKVAIASKADAFTKRFIAEKLKADFDARVKSLQPVKP